MTLQPPIVFSRCVYVATHLPFTLHPILSYPILHLLLQTCPWATLFVTVSFTLVACSQRDGFFLPQQRFLPRLIWCVETDTETETGFRWERASASTRAPRRAKEGNGGGVGKAGSGPSRAVGDRQGKVSELNANLIEVYKPSARWKIDTGRIALRPITLLLCGGAGGRAGGLIW